MGLERKPFQGVSNIVRFNWHFYLIAFLALSFAFLLRNFVPENLQYLFLIGWITAVITTLNSLIVSYFIYDISDLYSLPWLRDLEFKEPSRVLNISAGFDEISNYLIDFYPNAKITICDFYNPNTHTEVSIERARKIYPSHPDTIQVETSALPFEDAKFDVVNVFMAAHEIRNEDERVVFFQELNRITTAGGKIIVTEHLRDPNNFLAFTFGFLHFYSESSWSSLFGRSCLALVKKVRTTPFVTTFILSKDGTTP